MCPLSYLVKDSNPLTKLWLYIFVFSSSQFLPSANNKQQLIFLSKFFQSNYKLQLILSVHVNNFRLSANEQTEHKRSFFFLFS